MRKSQAGIEYLIVIGFVTLAIISIIFIAYFYSGMARDRIVLNQVEVFANKIINSAESVFYAGEPSRAYVTAYLPAQVTSIEIIDKNIVIVTSTSSGNAKRAFSSKVQLQGSISTGEGAKRIKLQAEQDKVLIS